MKLCIYNLGAFLSVVTYLHWPLFSGSKIRNMHCVETTMPGWTLMLLLGLEPGLLRSFSLHPSCHTYDLSRLTLSALKWEKDFLVIFSFCVHSSNSKPNGSHHNSIVCNFLPLSTATRRTH